MIKVMVQLQMLHSLFTGQYNDKVLAQLQMLYSLFNGQYNTKGYGTITDVI